MGTSTARRGPSSTAWRIAKGAATRYLASEGSSPVEAREVVQRYVAALEESGSLQGQDLLAGFRLTRKAAQALGEFGDLVAATGMAAALATLGFDSLADMPPDAIISGLPQAWLEDQGSLEAAVARSALATCLAQILGSYPKAGSGVDAPSLVGSFLAAAFCQRLALDLGESLEAAAAGWPAYQKGLARLQNELLAAVNEIPPNPPGAGQWRGLAGWLWVTQVLEKILTCFKDARPSP